MGNKNSLVFKIKEDGERKILFYLRKLKSSVKTDFPSQKNDTLHNIRETQGISGVYISKYKTELALSKYAPIITRVLSETKASLRTANKSMMTPRGRGEAHITTRGKHQEQVGNIAEEIAKELGLNSELARLIGYHHDDGHTFNGHTGERIMSSIGELLNCGYTVHNALSVDMLLSEDVLCKIQDAIRIQYPEISDEELEQVKQEMHYVFDGIVSHNGEGTDKQIIPNFDKKISDVIEEKNKCYQVKQYDKGIKPMTMEGAIIRLADIIAYTRTDTLDGFQTGLITGFDEESLMSNSKPDPEKPEEFVPENFQEYLMVIGTASAYRDKLFSKDKNQTFLIDEYQALQTDSSIITRQIARQEKLLKELIKKKKSLENDEQLAELNETNNKIAELDEGTEELRAKLNSVEQQYKECQRKIVEQGRAYVNKTSKELRKDEVVNMLQNMFIKDLKEFSKDKDYIGLSPIMGQALFDWRNANLDYIVKYTRRTFENTTLPPATLQLVQQLSQTLIDTGIIYNQVIPESYKSLVKRESDEEHTQEKIDILEQSAETKEDEYEYQRKVYHRCGKLMKNLPEKANEICTNALLSISDIARQDVKMALSEAKYEGEYPKENKAKLDRVRQIIMEVVPTSSDGYIYISEEQRETIINKIITERRIDVERICACAFAKEYVAGMSDDTIIDAFVKQGIITPEQANEARNRDIENKTVDRATQELGNQWKQTDESEETTRE